MATTDSPGYWGAPAGLPSSIAADAPAGAASSSYATDLAELLMAQLTALRDPARATAQQRYFKTSQPLLGTGVPAVRAAVQHALAAAPPEDAAQLAQAAATLSAGAHYREQSLAAILLLSAAPARRLWRSTTGAQQVLPVVAEQALRGRWWDLVDAQLPLLRALGNPRYPARQVCLDQLAAWSRRQAAPEQLWLRRLSIIGQIGLKADTDTALLAANIDRCLDYHLDFHRRWGAEEPEGFFIRKAIGWALREHSKTDPQWVAEFVAARPQLPALSRREATRLLPPSLR